ncbi:MAG: DUF3883 domain-containing protein [Vicinamibacterales bacterium]
MHVRRLAIECDLFEYHLTGKDSGVDSSVSSSWSLEEVEAVVTDYFAMLEAELLGQRYSKAEHNRKLQKQVPRSAGSIEFKHQNISAVLINFRQPFIPGYLPRQNYQQLLERVVLEWLTGHADFFRSLADGPVLAPVSRPSMSGAVRTSDLVVPPPEASTRGVTTDHSQVRFYNTDFVRRDAENRMLGRLGEEWVVDFEKRRLHDDARRPDLARRVEWIADTRGDSAGYDIASFDGDESPRLIEVKTTGSGKQFPFLVTSNEVRVSEREARRYHLYRVFEFAKDPRMYILRGALSEVCRLEPTQYQARPGSGSIEREVDAD